MTFLTKKFVLKILYEKEQGVRKISFFIDVIYGRPLRVIMRRILLNFPVHTKKSKHLPRKISGYDPDPITNK